MSDTKAMQRLCGLMRKAVQQYEMLAPGDRVLVGVSGGKDSVALSIGLARLRQYLGFPFEVVAVTLDPQFGGKPVDYSALEALFRRYDVPYEVRRTLIGPIVFDYRNEKNPCSLCAKMRRGSLHTALREAGIHKVALGHHYDDAVETFLMSLVFEGRMHTFAPRTYLSRADITVIRPMIYVHEKDIVSIAKKLELPVVPNNCPADGITKRHSMKEEMARLEAMNFTVKERMLHAVTTSIWAPLMLPEEEQIMIPMKKEL